MNQIHLMELEVKLGICSSPAIGVRVVFDEPLLVKQP